MKQSRITQKLCHPDISNLSIIITPYYRRRTYFLYDWKTNFVNCGRLSNPYQYYGVWIRDADSAARAIYLCHRQSLTGTQYTKHVGDLAILKG